VGDMFDYGMGARSVPITGEVLSWAMLDAGVDPRTLANAAGVTPDVVAQWENELTRPSTGQFRSIAKTLRRPESFFLLERPPAKPPLVADFRRSSEDDEPLRLYPEEAETVRRAKSMQEIAAWIFDEMAHRRLEIPRLKTSVNPEVAGADLRAWLGWEISFQAAADSTEAKASGAMRDRLQDLGILTFNFSLQNNRVRGFSLSHPTAPVIAVNTQDPHRARLFSYCHELAHLTLRAGSFCFAKENKGVEAWCNQVAAALLVPRSALLDYMASRRITSPVADLSQVATIRNYFKVSLRAVAIRLEHIGLAAQGLYDRVNREAEPKPRGGRGAEDDPRGKPIIRLRTYGTGMISRLLDAEELGVISQYEVQDILRVSRKEFHEMRLLASSASVALEV
jgi:Zn-dependent peptidase ImmA (M78 family)